MGLFLSGGNVGGGSKSFKLMYDRNVSPLQTIAGRGNMEEVLSGTEGYRLSRSLSSSQAFLSSETSAFVGVLSIAGLLEFPVNGF